MPYPESTPSTTLENKDVYLSPDGKVNRERFRYDIIRCARERGAPLPNVLKEFFEKNEGLSKQEMGSFALNTSATGNLVDGTVTLIHTLEISAGQASSLNVLEEYMNASSTDPMIWGLSWIIDNMMNWPQGTILPASRNQLAKI